MPRSLYALLALFLSCGSASAEEGVKAAREVVVWIRVIDKVAGVPQTFETPMGTAIHYQTLSVLPRKCSVNEDGEYAALLEVYDQPPTGGTVETFSGWMFSASPSLTFIEHPFYDVSLVKCAPREAKKDDAVIKNP